jgi:ABC-type sugar transport system permease subunit
MRPWTPYAFLGPYLVLFTVFMVLPIGFGFWTSVFDFLWLSEGFRHFGSVWSCSRGVRSPL